jgi:hypothetical protein
MGRTEMQLHILFTLALDGALRPNWYVPPANRSLGGSQSQPEKIAILPLLQESDPEVLIVSPTV